MRRHGGFTLVELLVVILIIAILAAIGAAVYAQSQVKARDAKRRSDMVTIADAFEQYYITNSEYPASVSTPTQYYVNAGVPRDPKSNTDGTCKTGSNYCYDCAKNGSSCSTTSFKICALLETGDTFCKGNRQ